MAMPVAQNFKSKFPGLIIEQGTRKRESHGVSCHIVSIASSIDSCGIRISNQLWIWPYPIFRCWKPENTDELLSTLTENTVAFSSKSLDMPQFHIGRKARRNKNDEQCFADFIRTSIEQNFEDIQMSTACGRMKGCPAFLVLTVDAAREFFQWWQIVHYLNWQEKTQMD